MANAKGTVGKEDSTATDPAEENVPLVLVLVPEVGEDFRPGPRSSRNSQSLRDSAVDQSDLFASGQTRPQINRREENVLRLEEPGHSVNKFAENIKTLICKKK